MLMLPKVLGNVVSHWNKNHLLRVSNCACKYIDDIRSSKCIGLQFITQYVNKSSNVHSHRQAMGVEDAVGKEKSDSLGSGGTSQKMVKVAVVGTPNAGKSTFVNQILGRRVCSISSKVHTTRNSVRAIMNVDHTQVIFLDTPGLISASESKRHNLEKSFFVDAELSMQEADLVVVIHDVSNVWTRGRLDVKVIRLLHFYSEKPVVLVMNKVDVLRSKRKLLDLTQSLTCGSLVDGTAVAGPADGFLTKAHGTPPLRCDHDVQESSEVTGWPSFHNVFMISALKGEGVDEVKDYILSKAKVRPWLYPPSVFTDQKMEDLIILAVREKLLENLPQEIPYNIETELEHTNVSPAGDVAAVVLVRCALVRHAKLALGAGGRRIRRVAKGAEQALEATLLTNVRLNLVVQSGADAK